jgi:hypothetical protein
MIADECPGVPDSVGFGHNIIVSGSDNFVDGNGEEGGVPEPATLALIGVGLAGVGFRRKKTTY